MSLALYLIKQWEILAIAPQFLLVETMLWFHMLMDHALGDPAQPYIYFENVLLVQIRLPALFYAGTEALVTLTWRTASITVPSLMTPCSGEARSDIADDMLDRWRSRIFNHQIDTLPERVQSVNEFEL